MSWKLSAFSHWLGRSQQPLPPPPIKTNILVSHRGHQGKLFEVDTGVEGWDIRHTYTVIAPDEGTARFRAKQEFKQWLLTHVEVSFAREAKLLNALH